MTQHYTKNTVQAPEWCARCHTTTPHRILGGKKAGCKICEAKHEKAPPPPPPAPEQGSLF